MSTSRWTAGAAPINTHVEQAVLRDRSVARLRARLHLAVQPRHRSGRPGDARRGRPASCRGAAIIIASLPAVAGSPAEHRRRLRGPSRGAQPGHARSGAEGQQRHPRPRTTTRSARTRAMMEHGIAGRGDPRAPAPRVRAPALKAWPPVGTARWARPALGGNGGAQPRRENLFTSTAEGHARSRAEGQQRHTRRRRSTTRSARTRAA